MYNPRKVSRKLCIRFINVPDRTIRSVVSFIDVGKNIFKNVEYRMNRIPIYIFSVARVSRREIFTILKVE